MSTRPAVIVRRYGTFCDVGLPDNGPLPERVQELLVPHMTYTHVERFYGADRYDPYTGAFRPVETTTVRLFHLENGRILTYYGFIPRILQLLTSAQIEYVYQDITPESKRGPQAYAPIWDRVSSVNFRYRQLECLQTITDSLGGIINAPPAFGKTFLCGLTAKLYPKAKIHYVVKRKDLVQKAYRELTRTLPSVGQIGGGKRQTDRRVTIFTADSLHRSDGDADFLFVDEAHEIVTPKYSQLIARLYGLSRNFGFTATPDGRMDGASAKLEYLFGPQIFYMSYTEARDNRLIVPIVVDWINICLDRNPCAGKSGVVKKRWGLWRNEERNAKIAERMRAHGADEQCLILVETIDHAVHLWQHLQDYTLCYGNMADGDDEQLGYFKRNRLLPQDYRVLTSDAREQLRLRFEAGDLKKVIATDVWSTGVSFDQLSVLCRADARTSEIMNTQAPGRVSRLHAGKESGRVYDTFDVFDRGFKLASQGRYRAYAKLGYEQVRPRVLRS